jgi:uncharacterized protein (DUF1697 family)
VPSVVFMRAVNVGGHKTFQPSALAVRLAELRVVSVGAAGTFVVGANATEAKIRAAFRKQLTFDAEMMICPARDLVALVELDPFSGRAYPKVHGQYVCVLASPWRKPPRLPLFAPEGRDWQVALTALHGCFVATVARKFGGRQLYPNEVVEKHSGVAATTRGWPTLLKLRELLGTKAAGGDADV